MFKYIFSDIKRFTVPRRKFSNVFSFLLANIVIFLCEEGLIALFFYRISRLFWNGKLKGLSFILSKLGLFCTGIFIHPSTVIGKGCKLNHSNTTIRAKSIGDYVEITGNVTIGEITSLSDEVPTIGNDVYIGAGARIFADIGDRVVVGANAVINRDVPDNCYAVGIPAKIMKRELK